MAIACPVWLSTAAACQFGKPLSSAIFISRPGKSDDLPMHVDNLGAYSIPSETGQYFLSPVLILKRAPLIIDSVS